MTKLMQNFKLPQSWSNTLDSSFNGVILKELDQKIHELKRHGIVIFPPLKNIFHALELVDYSDVKVLILGQDPYHQSGQANGLAFSVNLNLAIPPSLKNIYLELQSDLGFNIPTHGDLTSWSREGVLLLNSVLTVEEGVPNSHKDLGWNKITDAIISSLSKKGGIIFLLWGKFAQQKINLIDTTANHILCSPHPSPLSSYRGFFGSKPFSKVNSILAKSNCSPINWKID
jgi:uracil-DNA glycosylase